MNDYKKKIKKKIKKLKKYLKLLKYPFNIHDR